VNRRTLYLVATGAPLTRRAPDLIPEARNRGWEPVVVASRSALGWLDQDRIRQQGVMLLDGHRSPDQAKRQPPAEGVILAPGTFNSINKLAQGIADTYALSVLNEHLGLRTPMVIVPFVNQALAGHPIWQRSLDFLQEAGVTLIDPINGANDDHTPMRSGDGPDITANWRWSWALSRLQPR
jgi:hypothetical protein